MAMTTCTECGAKVSTAAKACPSCGAPPPKRTSTGVWIVGGLFALVVWKIAADSVDRSEANVSSKSSPTALAAAQKSDRDVNLVLAGARLLKQGMKKPETFELVSATMIGDDTICYEYKARNSFNDVAHAHYVVSNTVSSGGAKEWNRLCAGKQGTDFTYVSASM